MVYGNQNHNRSPNTDRWWEESQRTLDAITGDTVESGDTDPAPVSPVAEPAPIIPNPSPIKLRDAVLMMPDPPAARTGPSIVGNGDEDDDYPTPSEPDRTPADLDGAPLMLGGLLVAAAVLVVLAATAVAVYLAMRGHV